MARVSRALLIVAALGLGACMMEQYHFPQTQDNVPVKVVLAFGDKWPNDTIKSITEQKMMDGKSQYTFVSTSSKHTTDRVTVIAADGTVLPDMPM
jgi:hypothetical protein